MNQRQLKLTGSGLPGDFPNSITIAKWLTSHITDLGYFRGKAWIYESLENYVAEVLVIDEDSVISESLSGLMAETNAEFTDYPYYESPRVLDAGSELVVTVSGSHQGSQLDDKPFSGDTIDMEVTVTLPRVAGKRGFLDYTLDTIGTMNDEWIDPELRDIESGTRPKDQFIEMTGGFRLGESSQHFQQRQQIINTIRRRFAEGKAIPGDLKRLTKYSFG